MHSVARLFAETGPWGFGLVVAAGFAFVASLVALVLAALKRPLPGWAPLVPATGVFALGCAGVAYGVAQVLEVLAHAPADQAGALGMMGLGTAQVTLVLAAFAALPAALVGVIAATLGARARAEAGVDDVVAVVFGAVTCAALPGVGLYALSQRDVFRLVATAPADQKAALVSRAVVDGALSGSGTLLAMGVALVVGVALYFLAGRPDSPPTARVGHGVLALVVAAAGPLALVGARAAGAPVRAGIEAAVPPAPEGGVFPASTVASPYEARPVLEMRADGPRVLDADEADVDAALASAWERNELVRPRRMKRRRGLGVLPKGLPPQKREGDELSLLVAGDAPARLLKAAVAVGHRSGATRMGLVVARKKSPRRVKVAGIRLPPQLFLLAIAPARRGALASSSPGAPLHLTAALQTNGDVALSTSGGSIGVVPRAQLAARLFEIRQRFPGESTLRVLAPDDATVQDVVSLLDVARETEDGRALFPDASLAVFDPAPPPSP